MPDEQLQIRAITERLERAIARTAVKISLDVVANLTDQPPLGTPVDTGWARANWLPSIGRSRNAPVGTKKSVSTDAQSAGIGTLGRYRLSGGNIFISNNVPYILLLNDGSSKQSPAAFVQIAIQKAVSVDIQGFSP